MKIKWKHVAIVAIAVVAAGCSSETDDVEDWTKCIMVSANVGSLTRATETAFEEGDMISIYAWTGSVADVGSLVVNNALNTYNESVWIANPQMLWKDMTTPHFFLGVYPHRSISDFKADVFASTPDLLVATLLDDGRIASNGIVPLTFNHVMSRLDVNLKFRSQFNGTPTVKWVSTEGIAGARVDYLAQVATPDGITRLISLDVVQANGAYSGIVAPQSISKIQIAIEDKVYTYTHHKDIVLEKGMVQTVNLIVGRDQIDLGSVVINDWTSGLVINDGEAQIE